MKNIFKYSTIVMLFMTVVSCVPTSDDDLTVMVPSVAPKLTAPATGTVYVLDKTKPDNQATKFVWDTPKYDGAQTTINYDVEMAKAGTNFKVVTVVSKTTDLFAALTVAQLNQAALDAGLTPNAASDADVRIKSYIGTNGVPQYSNVITIKITSYLAWDDWGIIGDATPSGWDSDTDLVYDSTTKKYTYDGPLKVGGYKFRKDNDWAVNYGDKEPDLILDTKDDNNIKITVAGNYLITVDFKALKYTVVKK
jgi:hypothetical protein